MKCKKCDSCQREKGVDLDLCDVCYWIKRAKDLQYFITKARTESQLVTIDGENKIAVPYWFMKGKV